MALWQRLFFFCCVSWGMWAHSAPGVSLWTWQPGTTSAPLILPVRSGETPLEAAQRYLRGIERTPDLFELFDGRLPELPLDGFAPP